MIQIKTLVFNQFQVNTYILWDETGEALIIDPGCVDAYEEKQLTDFIEFNHLKIVRLFNTHPHIDHIAGNKFVAEHFNIGLEIHKESMNILKSVYGYAAAFGFPEVEVVEPSAYIEEGDLISFGNSEMKVLYTPGHSDGSVCFYVEKDNLVIVGDVIFRESIGRADFPTGNIFNLKKNIRTKLFVLPDETVVYPGHGPSTTIGYEKKHNPFMS